MTLAAEPDLGSPPPTLAPATAAWPLALALLVASIAWVLFWYRDTALAMVGIWYRSETFAHAFVVPPISLWLIWRQRNQLKLLTPRASPWVWPLLALPGFAWLLGELVAVNAVTQLALVSTLVLLVPALLGATVARAILFPLAFLFFAVPVGEFVMPQLMDWTAQFTVAALRLSGIPVFQEGLHFVIPSGRWSVVEACSGVRYLIASLTVGTLYAYLTYTSPLRRWVFVGVSILVPILANWARAYMIVMLGHLSGNTLAVGVDHLIYGWLFFGIVIMLMFMIGARWAEEPVATSGVAPAKTELAMAPAWTWLGLAVLAALTASPHLALRQIEGRQAQTQPRLAAITAAAGWTAVAGPESFWQPAFENPSATSTRFFEHDGQQVGVHLLYYRNQGFGRKLVSSSNVLVHNDEKHWALAGAGVREISLGGQTLNARTAELRRGDLGSDERVLVWHWYWINGRITASDIRAKIYGALAQLQGLGDESAAVMVFAQRGAERQGEASIAAFVAAHQGAIDAALRHTGEQR